MTGILGAMVGSSGGPTIQLVTPVTLSYLNNAAVAIVAYALDPDGYVYTSAGSTLSYVQQEQWDNMPATTGNYEVRATLVSGTTPGGPTIGSWNIVSARQAWTLVTTSGFVKTCVLTIEVRDTATSTVKATATVTLTADSR
jgi:hypothetical protein